MAGEIAQPRATGFFIKSLNSARKEIVEMTFEEVAKLAKNGATMFEVLKDGQYYTFFTDCDHYCKTIEPPDDDYIDDVKERMFNNLGKLMNDQFTDEHKGTFGLATRHGVHVEKNIYKLSWRCYFFGFVMTLAGMREIIVQKGLDKAGIGSLDSSPYNKNQLLGCVGFSKSKTDKRVLVPAGDSQPLEKFMVQNTTCNDIILSYDGEIDDENFEEVSLENSHESKNFDHPRFAPPWDFLERLVMNLDVEKRCKGGTYQQWARVGWAIAGVARAANKFEDGLKLWMQFCRQSMEAYLENPMKAQIIYRCAKKRNEQLGWKSLLEALKEDNFEVFESIKGQLHKQVGADSHPVEDPADQKILKKFIKLHFHHQSKHVKDIVVRTYDSGKFIIASTDETTCPIIEEDHENNSGCVYIVIGLKAARDKCRHENCKDKTNIVVDAAQYPDDIRLLVKKLLNVELTPEAAIQNFVIEHKAANFSRTEDLELGEVQSSPFGNRYMLTKNRFCQICNCHHPNPENCIIVDQTAKLLAMECRLNPYNFHPPGGIALPQNVTNVIIQNAYITTTKEDLEDDIFDEEFPIFQERTLNHLINVSFKGFASDIARVFVHLGKDSFGVQSGDKDIWWAWDKKEMRWLQSQHKANIFCDSVLADHYAKVTVWLRRNTPDNDKRSKRLQKIENLLKRLKDRDQHSILTQAAILLKEDKRNFEFILDSNKDLLNFKGEVFDFDTLSVREVLPSDHVSLTTGYTIPAINIGKRTKVMDIIRSVMPDKQHVDYLLLHLAGCLDGWNREETFSILSGSGRNGKGILSLLMEHALGKTNGYFKDVKAELLTKERPSADRPVPELLSTNGKRLIVASEPEAGSKINTGFLKFLTGNDPISGRWLHGNNEISFSPQHSLWLLCNSIPALEAHDEAVWDRSRVIEFPFHFVDNPQTNTERKIDRSLKRCLPSLAPQLMLILLEAYAKYKREGLSPTPQMQAFTQNIRQENDAYSQYIEDQLNVTGIDTDRIVQSELESACHEWIKSRFRGFTFDKKTLWKVLSAHGVVRKTKVRIGKGTPQGFCNVRLKNIEPTFIEEC